MPRSEVTRATARRAAILPAREPRGLGTPEVESLTSYLRGVATLHVVPVSWLATTFVFDPLRRARGQGDLLVQPTRATESLNGAGLGTRRIVGQLAAVTGKSRLVETTLLELGLAIECREGFRSWRAWCSACLDADGDAAYDRLAWSLRCTIVCARHRVVLRDECVQCRTRHRPLARLANPWSCPRCGAPLGGRGQVTRLDAVSVAGLGLIGQLARGVAPNRAQIRARFALGRERAGGVRALATVLSVAPSTVSALCAGSTRPHLELLVSLEAWLAAASSTRPPRAARAGGYEAVPAEAALRDALAATPPPSLRVVARGAGTTPATLTRRLSALTRAVVLRRRRWLRERAAARRRRVLAAVSAALAAAGGSGPGLPRRALEACLVRPGLLRDPSARAFLEVATASQLGIGKRASYGRQTTRAPGALAR